MRRRELKATPEIALEVFRRAPVVHLFVEGPEVRPIHAVVVGGRVYFRGAVKGEKAGWVGKPAALSAHEVVAVIPSYFRHPERACPATTFYRSAELRGPIVEVEGEEKVHVLRAFTHRFQPEGGYRPIDPKDPVYTGAIQGVKVWTIRGEPVARVKLGQGLPDPDRHRVQEGLWNRGAPGDEAAIEAIQDASNGPLPRFLQGPEVRLLARVPDSRVLEAVALLRDQYWNAQWDDASIARAQLGAAVWVGAVHDDRLVATARALCDGGKMTYIADVAVHEAWRGRGVGRAVLELLGDHPRVRKTRWTSLHTRGAEAFYERLGYRRFEPPPTRTELRVVRDAWLRPRAEFAEL